MNYYNGSNEMQALERKHRAAKSKMTSGIVLTTIGFFLFYFGIIFLFLYFLGILLIIPSIPMLIIGIINLVNGIKGRLRINRQIKILKQQNSNAQYANNYAYQPNVPQNPNGRYHPTEPQTTNANYSYQPNVPQNPNNSGSQLAAERYFVDIDLNKYSPLDCGVTYKSDKDYKFQRADGFVGSVPQNFVNRTFPKCPLCCNNPPDWTISGEGQMSWKGNLYYFKCSRCNGIISMSVPDVTTLGNGGSGVAYNPSVGLTNMIAKKSSGKDAVAVYAAIESVGRSGVSKICEGKEFKLEQMQDMFMRM